MFFTHTKKIGGLRDCGESWEMHYETRCAAIFMCTLTKVCFLHAVRWGREGAPENMQACRWRERARKPNEPPLRELKLLVWICDPWPQLCWITPPTLLLKASNNVVSSTLHGGPMWNTGLTGMHCVLCRSRFKAHQVVYSLLRFGYSYVTHIHIRFCLQVQWPEAADRVCGGVCPPGS